MTDNKRQQDNQDQQAHSETGKKGGQSQGQQNNPGSSTQQKSNKHDLKQGEQSRGDEM